MSTRDAAVVLETRDLSVRYGNVQALREASIRVCAGEIVTIIGPNGAGKSSLLNAAIGALPGNGRAYGEVILHGQNVAHDPIEVRLGRGLALVPERRELFATMSVEDNLVLGAFRRRKAGETAREGLDRVYQVFPRLRERRTQLAGTMSGGERQMVAIGRALMSDPRVLMLDEPSLGLAPLVTAEVFRVISRLRETGVSVLLIEQNSRAALQVSDYGYVLEVGDLTLEGQSTELMQNPKVIEAYLGARR